MEMNIQMGVNCKPRLLPKVYNSLQSFVEFKENFHHVFIRARKDPTKTWHALPYLETDDVIFVVLESWPLEWCTPAGSVMDTDKSTTQHKKEETKLRIV